MARTVGYRLALAAAVAALLVAGWPGPAADPATLISRISVLAVAGLLAGMPRLVLRRFGPLARGWVPVFARATGCAAVVALLAVKARAERTEFAVVAARPSPAGLWAGEAIFLAVIAGYLAVLLVVTSSRSPATRATLVIGGGTGAGIGLAVYGLRPLDNTANVASGAVGALCQVARALAVPLVLAAVIAAGAMAARRAPGRAGSRASGQAAGRASGQTAGRAVGRTRRAARVRQGLAAGACAGFVAAVVVSLLGIATIAVLPHAATWLQWTLPGRAGETGSVYGFEAGLTDAGAGYLIVLVAFPLLGAGLGAWAGQMAGGSGLRPDGGGGGGRGRPGPGPRPPDGGRHAPPPDLSPAELSRLLGLADWRIIAVQPDKPGTPAPAPEPERVPVGVP